MIQSNETDHGRTWQDRLLDGFSNVQVQETLLTASFVNNPEAPCMENGIFTSIGLVSGVNVGIHDRHGVFGSLTH